MLKRTVSNSDANSLCHSRCFLSVLFCLFVCFCCLLVFAGLFVCLFVFRCVFVSVVCCLPVWGVIHVNAGTDVQLIVFVCLFVWLVNLCKPTCQPTNQLTKPSRDKQAARRGLQSEFRWRVAHVCFFAHTDTLCTDTQASCNSTQPCSQTYHL